MSKKATITRETKTLSFQVKAVEISTNAQGQEVGKIEAYGAVFNNIDEGNDRILSGSFTRTIKNSKSRAEARDKPYLLKMLWQHKTDEVIGGWSDLSEDNFGLRCSGDVLLATQRGKEYYELAKAGMIDEFSIIYDVMPDGASYDKSGVRDLSELRLLSIDPVTFAMNDETYLVGVKAASGKTSWPLADRDAKWDAGQARKDIQEWAGDDWSKVAQCFFWVAKSPPEKLGDCKLPFVAKDGDEMKAIPQGIISGAGVVRGSMGGASIDDVAGVKAKIAAYYKKMDMKPPWEDDNDKSTGEHMTRKSKEKKTFGEHYAEEMCEDLLEDWQDVFLCSLTCAILDAFKIGDTPVPDITAALDDFKELVLSKFVTEAIECDLSGYLTDHSHSSADYTMQYGSDSKPNYGYMSNNRRHASKAGKPISSANQQRIDDHVSNLKSLADNAMSSMKEHTKAIRTAADDFATTMQGAEVPYAGDDPGKPDDGRQEGKSNTATPPQQEEARSTSEHSHESTADEDERELEQAFAFIKDLMAA